MTRLHGRTAVTAAITETLCRILVTVLSILFARALGPEQMGLLAAAQFLPNVLGVLTALAETAALVRTPTGGSDVSQARAAAALRVLLTVLCLPLVPTLGPILIRSVLGSGPDLSRGRVLLGILTLGLVVEALGAYPRVMLQRRLRLRAVIGANLAQVTTHFTVAIVLLSTGRGLEALCASVVLSQAVGAGVVWAVAPRTPGSIADRERPPVTFQPLVGQYMRLLTSAVLGHLNMRLDNYLVGATLGASSMGLYSMAWTASRLVAVVVSQIYSLVVLPVLAASTLDAGRFQRESARAVHWALWGVTCVGAMTWITCDPLAPLILGERWRPLVLPLRIMLLSLLCSPVISGAHAALVAEGRAERVALATMTNFVIVLVAVPPAARAFGLAGAAVVDVFAAATVAAILIGSCPSFLRALSSTSRRNLLVPVLAPAAGAAAAMCVETAAAATTVAGRLLVFAAITALAGLSGAGDMLKTTLRGWLHHRS